MTDSITQCPNCRTTFRVTQVQLEVAHGKVRCGTCLRVCDATDHMLVTEWDDEADIEHDAQPRVPTNQTDNRTPLDEAHEPSGQPSTGENEEPSAHKEPSADEEPSVHKDPPADNLAPANDRPVIPQPPASLHAGDQPRPEGMSRDAKDTLSESGTVPLRADPVGNELFDAQRGNEGVWDVRIFRSDY